MTCIVGYVKGTRVWMGGDSRAIFGGGAQSTTIAGQKVFIRETMMIGVAGSARLSNLIGYGFEPPNHPLNISKDEYIALHVTTAVRELLDKHGSGGNEDGQDFQNGTLLIAYSGGLYTMSSDYSILQSAAPYAAIGSGAPYALGALAVLSPRIAPEQRLYRALQAAAVHDPFVGAPFYTLCADWSDKEEAP